MAKIVTFINNSFEYKITLQDSVLHILAKHIDDCYTWSTIIEDTLKEPDTIKSEQKKKFVINLDPDEMFDIFFYYEEKSLHDGITITFPTLYKNIDEHIIITIDVKLLLGKKHNNTQWIILEPENIAKDEIIFQKINNLSNKMGNKIVELESSIKSVENNIINTITQEILPQEIEKFEANYLDKFNQLVNKVNPEMNEIDKIYIDKYEKLENEFNALKNATTVKINIIQNILSKEISVMQGDYSTKIGELENTINVLEKRINSLSMYEIFEF